MSQSMPEPSCTVTAGGPIFFAPRFPPPITVLLEYSDSCLRTFLSRFSRIDAACSGMDFGQLEQPVGHRWGSHGRPREPRHHGGKIVSSVETILELGQITRHVLLFDRAVGSNDGGLDIAQRRVDPSERRGACRGRTGAGLDDLMRTPGVGDSGETGQTVADDLAPRIKAAFCKIRQGVIAEAGNPTQLQAYRLAPGRGLASGGQRG